MVGRVLSDAGWRSGRAALRRPAGAALARGASACRSATRARSDVGCCWNMACPFGTTVDGWGWTSQPRTWHAERDAPEPSSRSLGAQAIAVSADESTSAAAPPSRFIGRAIGHESSGHLLLGLVGWSAMDMIHRRRRQIPKRFRDRRRTYRRRQCVSPLPRPLLPDTATVGARRHAWSIGGCRVDELAAELRHAACSSTTRPTCGPAAARRSRRSAPGGPCTRPRRSCAGRWPASPHEEGMLLDVASGGELHVALAAGVPASACTMHGNNKSLDELRTAHRGRRAPHRRRQLRRARPPRRAARDGAGRPPDVLLRITPGVHAHTHEYIATGQDDSKFGFNLANGDAAAAVDRARRSASVNLVGLHCHIGSNVFAAESFGRAAEVMAGFAAPARPARARARRRARRRLRRGRGRRRRSREWAKVVLDACRALGVRVRRQRRAGPGDRRRGGGHACTRSARSSGSPACARTSPSTAA